jgi:tripartite-type tricarboxylate transporter receptor subunit TctC
MSKNARRFFRTGVLALRSLLCFAVALVAFGGATPSASAAEKYPSKQITILIGFETGSGSDTAARLQGAVMSKVLGVPVVVRNVPGAGGRNAVTLLNRAAPDGYTMAMVNFPGQLVDQIVRGMEPDVRRFTWIGRQLSHIYFLQASKKSPWNSLKDMKTAKNPIKAGITGTGGNTFPISVIAAELVGYPVRFVPGFKSSELITAIIRGDIEITSLPLLKPYITAVESGESTPIVVFGPDRHPFKPDIPTGADIGFPELNRPTIVGQNLYGLPPGTSPEIAAVLEGALTKATQDKETNKKMEGFGNVVAPLAARDCDQLVKDMVALVEKNKALLGQYIKK